MSTFYTNIQLAGDTILYRGYQDGDPVQFRTQFSPTLYVLSKNKNERFKTLDGRPVSPIEFTSSREAREFIKTYDGVEGFEVHGYERFVYQYMRREFPGDVEYDINQMKIYALDIEVQCENGFPDVEAAAEEMLSITIKDMVTKQYFVWAVREFEVPDGVKAFIYDTERDMLTNFMEWWVQNTPDILTGWNVNLYDVPYIARRLNRMLGEKWMKSLSPWNRANEREVYVQGRKNYAYDLSGINILDYLDLYRKFTYSNQESYRLDHIAFVELGQRKLDHSEYENFKDFYTRDWQKFIEYNIQDVELIDRLEDKMKLLELAITMSYDAKANFEDVYSQVRMWDTLIYNYLTDRNIVVPPKKGAKKDDKYAGAYVKEPKPGKYDWVVSFDLNSLYPHLIMQYNLSPETLLPGKRPSAQIDRLLYKQESLDDLKGCTVCANGTLYDTTFQGFLPKLMEKIYKERTIYKKKMIAAKKQYEKNPSVQLKKEIARCNNIQMARKIQLNSAYGAIGNEHFRYYRLEIAEAITTSGQLSIRWIGNKMNEYLNRILKTEGEDYVIASDTDSMYLNLGPMVESVYKGREKTDESVVTFLDKICNLEFEKYIESSYQELADYLNAYDQKMVMARENIASKGIWTAKKRYILDVWDSEGVRYEKPKMKIMGLETQRSSTPQYFRNKLLEAFKTIIKGTNEDVLDYIDHVKEDTRKQDPIDIAFPRGVNGLEKYKSHADIYVKGTPIHVRGALLYNYYVRKNKVSHKYAPIQEGEKIKFLYLKEPNPIGENVVSFMGTIPREFNVDNYIDYNLQFDKSFYQPLRNVLECIGWDAERRVSLLQFF